MNHAQILGILHFLAIVYLSRQVASAWVSGISRQLCAIGLLVWGNFVITALSVSCINRLNSLLWFEGVSICFALILWLVGTHVHAEPDGAPRTAAKWKGELTLRVVLIGGMIVCGALSFYILWTHSPSNWDSSAYRFPRALWYLQHGNLLHFANPYNDPRPLYYPFNGTILYIFMAMYQLGELAFTGVTFVAWCASGLGVYTTSRRFGASYTGSIVAAFLGILTPAVLCQATSTNDEILAASAILLAFPFAVDWAKTPKLRFGFLTGVGAGLGVGTKLHWAFYYPYLILAGIVAGIWIARNLELLRPQLKIRVTGIVLALVPLAIFGADFAVANWISAGVYTNSVFNDSVMNKPFNTKLAKEKIYAGTGQLFLSAIPDILRHGSQADVTRQYKDFNNVLDTALFSRVTEIRKISPEGFQFKGPLSDGPESYLMNEYTVFAGLLPWLIGASIVLAGFRSDVNKPALWVAASLLGWHVCYVLYTKYIPGASAYYTYPAIIASAGLAPLWDWSLSRPGILRFALAGFFALTTLTHSIVASHIFRYNTLRNVVYAWTKDPASNGHPIDPAMKEAIQLASTIHIPHLSWSQMMWHMMRHNLSATYTTGPVHVDSPLKELQLLGLLPANPDGRVAVVLPRGATTSAVYLGPAFGTRYYGAGAAAMGFHPEQTKLGIAGVGFPKVPSGKVVHIGGPFLGVKSSDGMQFRASLVSTATKRVFSGPWRSTSEIFSPFEIKESDVIDELWIDVRHPSKPKEYVRSYLPLTALSEPMPARAELLSDDPEGVAPETVKIAPFESASSAPKGPRMAVPDPGRGRAIAVKLISPAPQGVGTSFEKIDYFIRWIPKSSNYEFDNEGAPRKAEFAAYVARAQRNRTLRLKINGNLVATEGKITKVLWVNGMDEVRYPVNLTKGLNRFELFTPEELDPINTNNDKACCLLIGDPVVIVR